MKILKIIHGYPPAYNAGSEVYSQTICRELAGRHQVRVFSRFENPFIPDYAVSEATDDVNANIKLTLVNLPLEKHRYRFSNERVDKILGKLLDYYLPDIIHIGHLNHLSTSLVREIHKRNIPCIYTLHDYWLMCPRGQFIQRIADDVSEVWKLCDGQENSKCAKHCFSGNFTGLSNLEDMQYWKKWVGQRMELMHEISGYVDLFIAPAQYLMRRFIDDFGLDENKINYLDYGFDLTRLENRKRLQEDYYTFGYIGTHIPAKGINLLIDSFSQLEGNVQLKIWGRERGMYTPYLKEQVSCLPDKICASIKWMGEYRNEQIVQDVFNHCDCIVVPSIWFENSPLVIHEALQARVPVITANSGGMSEYIQHRVNGLLFEHRNAESLRKEMAYAAAYPNEMEALAEKGYLGSKSGIIPDVKTHVDKIEKIYLGVIERRRVYGS